MPFLGGVACGGVDVGDHRDGRCPDVDLGECLAQSVACRGHERGVEGATHRQGHGPLRPELLGDLAGGGHCVRRAGDDDLAGGVVVGDPHVAVDPCACGADEIVVEPEHGGHGAVLLVGGDLHGLAPFGDEADGVLEREGARRAQGAVLAERVSGCEARRQAGALDGVEDDHAEYERGELAVAGVLQLVGVGAEQQIGHVAAAGVGGLLDQLPGLVGDPGVAHSLFL